MTKKGINSVLIVVVIFNLAIDQISKYFARIYIQGQGIINVIGDFFILTYAENSGAFLGLGSNLPQPLKTFVLVLFPLIAIIAGILYLILGKNVSFKQSIAIACIIGGGIGNVYDRAIHLGAVTDFLNFGIGNIRTGILNIADLSITFGAIFLFIFQYIEEQKLKNDGTNQKNS
ncbi:signal peptidase II [Thiospirochaeta perfilievii]|uniref:Lipoprotein signal peptidase n=1 Tax=Thiospirochaeta perfilievii TaxID=252967 RepID=A0A5C1QIC1_9SPIO|nr:signal peptidase II [Thiospirochaeta perfilievii]QEN06284.1 signal peptidase II [Thiospirochaeta perfilievii]